MSGVTSTKRKEASPRSPAALPSVLYLVFGDGQTLDGVVVLLSVVAVAAAAAVRGIALQVSPGLCVLRKHLLNKLLGFSAEGQA